MRWISLVAALLFVSPIVAVPLAEATAKPLATVEIETTQIRLGDVVADAATPDVVVAPAPAPGGSRVLTRDDVVAALAAQELEPVPGIPDAIRVVRKMQVLSPAALSTTVKPAIAAAIPKRGIALQAIRQATSVRIAAGWTHVNATFSKPPRREGDWVTQVMVSFYADHEKVATLSVPVTMTIDAEAAKADVAKGDALVLVVRRGQVEVHVKAVAGADGDVGEAIPVTLRPSGKVLRAVLLSPDRALEEGSAP